MTAHASHIMGDWKPFATWPTREERRCLTCGAQEEREARPRYHGHSVLLERVCGAPKPEPIRTPADHWDGDGLLPKGSRVTLLMLEGKLYYMRCDYTSYTGCDRDPNADLYDEPKGAA